MKTNVHSVINSPRYNMFVTRAVSTVQVVGSEGLATSQIGDAGTSSADCQLSTAIIAVLTGSNIVLT